MLISHRLSAYVDDEELERTAGMLEIESKKCDERSEHYLSAVFHGAASALKTLGSRNLKEPKDFLAVFEHVAFDEEC